MDCNIEIVRLEEKHIPDIMKVEHASFSIPWSEKSFRDELKNSIAVYFAAVCNSIAIGYIGMWQIAGQSDITNIAVLPEYRRNSVASKLLSSLIEFCRENELDPITLEVRETNIPAINLYSKFGFEKIGERKKYYADTGENALIMSLTATTGE